METKCDYLYNNAWWPDIKMQNLINRMLKVIQYVKRNGIMFHSHGHLHFLFVSIFGIFPMRVEMNMNNSWSALLMRMLFYIPASSIMTSLCHAWQKYPLKTCLA